MYLVEYLHANPLYDTACRFYLAVDTLDGLYYLGLIFEQSNFIYAWRVVDHSAASLPIWTNSFTRFQNFFDDDLLKRYYKS